MLLSDADTGIWIVRTQKHLQDFVGTSPLNNYDCTIVSGLCGRLMARIRKLEVIDFQRLNVLASYIGIMKSMLRDVILPALASEGVVNVRRDNTGSISKVEEDIPPIESIPCIVTEIWNKRQPERVEIATIEAQRELLNRNQGKDFSIRNISGEMLLRGAGNGYPIYQKDNSKRLAL